MVRFIPNYYRAFQGETSMSAQPERRRSPLSWYFGTNLLTRIAVGLVMGAIVGLIFRSISHGVPGPTPADLFVSHVRFFGDVFIRLLAMIVVPVVFFSLIGGAANLALTHLGRVGFKVLGYYLFTSAVAVALGLALATLIGPGVRLYTGGSGAAAVAVAGGVQPSLSEAILAVIPTNPLAALARGEILPVIFFSIVFGVGISVLKDSHNAKAAKSAELLHEVCVAAADTMYKIMGGIMQYAPVGVFVLIACVFAEQGSRVVGTLLLVALSVYVGLVLHLVVCYGGFLAAYGLGLPAFVSKARRVMAMAFLTRSSAVTLPTTLRVTEEKMGAPRSIGSFSLPLGATINMDGTAVYLGVCAAFIGFAVDSPLTFAQQVVVVTATLASIGTAGVPGAGAVMLLMVMEAIGLPVRSGTGTAAAFALILGIDTLLDMGRTCLNVTGDMVGTVIVAKSERVLDMSCWEPEPKEDSHA